MRDLFPVKRVRDGATAGTNSINKPLSIKGRDVSSPAGTDNQKIPPENSGLKQACGWSVFNSHWSLVIDHELIP